MFQRLKNTNPIHPQPSRGPLVFRATASLIILSLLTAGFITNPGLTHAVTLATTKQPEGLTELYFNNSQNLPKQITAQKLSSFSYHVANHEGTDTIYHAQVTIVENGQARPLKEDDFVLPDGTTRDIIVLFTTTKPGTKLQLLVTLPDQNETISFRSQS